MGIIGFATILLLFISSSDILGLEYPPLQQVPLGLYVVRGENVVLLGEIDPAKDPPAALEKVAEEVIRRSMKAEKEQDKLRAAMAARFDFLED